MLEPLVCTTAAFGLHLEVSSLKALADSLDHAVLILILATRCVTQAVYFCSGDLSPPEYHHFIVGLRLLYIRTSHHLSDDMLMSLCTGYLLNIKVTYHISR